MYDHIPLDTCLGKKHSGLTLGDGSSLCGFRCSIRGPGLIEVTIAIMSL